MRTRPLAPVALLGLVLALLVGACGAPAASHGGGPLRVVTTTTIFADMVRQVAGSRVSVTSLVPKGGEVHTFDPRPSNIRQVTEAQVIFLNGLGLDDWLAAIVQDAGTPAPVVRLAEDLPGATLLPGEGRSETVNPHLWMNLAYGEAYAARIAATLTTIDPDGAAAYAAGLEAYRTRLEGLDAEARRRIAAVPEADRTVVAFHDAFPYFAQAYGLVVDGTIVSAPGQDPSAGEIANLVTVIRERHVRAIFAEAQFSEDLVRTIAGETGATVVSNLYTDSVGDPPQDTYEAMMRWNIDQVVAALGG